MLKIATFNVNSINARFEHVKKHLEDASPDILALQELKCESNKFPMLEFQGMGYHCYLRGQKAYNGVAILSKKQLNNVITDMPDFSTDQARFIQGDINDSVTLINIYAPNGNPPATAPESKDKLHFKVDWFDALKQHIRGLMMSGKQVIIVGDWNVIIDERDVYNPKSFEHDALFLPEVRAKYREIENLGLVNIIKSTLQPQNSSALYSWWSYKWQAYEQNRGVLIDHILTTPTLAQTVAICGIDRKPREQERPSDHTLVWAEFNIS